MKRIRTNRRRRMKLKNFIACVTALSVVMGSSYFAMAEDSVPAADTPVVKEISKAPVLEKPAVSVKDILSDLKADTPVLSEKAAELKELPDDVKEEIAKEKLEGIVEKAPEGLVVPEKPAVPEEDGEGKEEGGTKLPVLPHFPSIDLPADFKPLPVVPGAKEEQLKDLITEAPEEIIISHHKQYGSGGGGSSASKDEADFTRAERVVANYVLKLINEMPTLDEIDAKMAEFETEEEYLAWGEKALAEREEALAEYMTLSDAQKEWIRENVNDLDELIGLVGEAMVFEGVSNINIVSADKAPNVTVKVFNYDDTVNTREDGLGSKGYVFFHQANGPYEEGGALYNTDEKLGSKDGPGDVSANTYNRPKLKDKLEDGYPYVDNDKTGDDAIKGSLEYLFSEGTGSYHKGTMSDGGDLFQKDSNGYYYYDSAENAAVFNGTKFDLYNINVVPYYNDGDSSGHGGNFLPFNKIVGTDSEGNEVQLVEPFEDDDGDENEDLNKYRLKKDNPTDNWFGMIVEFDFFMPEGGKLNEQDMIFEFSGDDDVWVFIDDTLVMDIGGTHGVQSGTINFATGKSTFQHNVVPDGGGVIDKTLDNDGDANGVTETTWDFKDIFKNATNVNSKISEGDVTFGDFTQHTFKFFYMERGGNISNCKIKFNMPTLPSNALMVGKEIVTDSTDEGFLDTMEYTFRVIEAETSKPAEGEDGTEPAGEEQDTGESQESEVVSFFAEGTEYAIYEDHLDTGRTGTVDANGCFTLKAGEQAVFANMMGENGERKDDKYIVQELIPNPDKGQYGDVEYKLAGTTGAIDCLKNNVVIDRTTFTGFETEKLGTTTGQTVTFTNTVVTSKLGSLKISKEVSADSLFEADKRFEVEVKLGSLADGTEVPYTLTKADDTVDENRTKYTVTDGVGTIWLADGETVLIEGILSGTEYEISEKGSGFVPVYTGTVTGTFDQSEDVTIGIRNYSNKFEVEIPVTKTTYGVAVDETFAFDFDIVLDHAVDEDNQPLAVDAFADDMTITVERTAEETLPLTNDTGVFKLKFNKDVPDGTYFYKVTECTDAKNYPDDYAGRFIYDDTVYMLGIRIDQDAKDYRATLVSCTKGGKELLAEGQTVNPEAIAALEFTNRNPGGGGGDKEYVTVRVEKKWAGTLAEGEEHPESVQVQLKIDGAYYGSKITLDKDNDWTYTWTDLRVDDDARIEVVEDSVAGYTGETVKIGNSFTITNTKDGNPDPENKPDPEDKPDPENKPDPDDDGDVLGIDDENVPKGDMVLADEEEVLAAETGDSNHALAAFAAMIAALAGIVLLKKRKAN